MSGGRSMWVTCDGSTSEMCDEEVVLMGTEATLVKVRTEARRRGWVRAGELDLCPEHTSSVAEATA